MVGQDFGLVFTLLPTTKEDGNNQSVYRRTKNLVCIEII